MDDCILVRLRYSFLKEGYIMLHITLAGTELKFDEASLHFSMTRNGCGWDWEQGYVPCFTIQDREIPFRNAGSITHEIRETGLGKGILSRYGGFLIDGKPSDLFFATYVWIESATGNVFFEWIPLCEDNIAIKAVFSMDFAEKREDWYTLLNQHQIQPRGTFPNKDGGNHVFPQTGLREAVSPPGRLGRSRI